MLAILSGKDEKNKWTVQEKRFNRKYKLHEKKRDGV